MWVGSQCICAAQYKQQSCWGRGDELEVAAEWVRGPTGGVPDLEIN